MGLVAPVRVCTRATLNGPKNFNVHRTSRSSYNDKEKYTEAATGIYEAGIGGVGGIRGDIFVMVRPTFVQRMALCAGR